MKVNKNNRHPDLCRINMLQLIWDNETYLLYPLARINEIYIIPFVARTHFNAIIGLCWAMGNNYDYFDTPNESHLGTLDSGRHPLPSSFGPITDPMDRLHQVTGYVVLHS